MTKAPFDAPFIWAVGIEDTNVGWPLAGSPDGLDEYTLTQHYAHWRADLALAEAVGARQMRYGFPWYRLNPAKGEWDWRFADEVVDEANRLGLGLIVDLVHYGLPAWIEDAWLNPDYPKLVADYAARVAERFKGRIHWYTPLNEPRVTAWYCGRLGWWPPYRRSWRGFVAIMLAVAAGIQETVAALRSVDPEIVAYHVDPTDLYRTDDPGLEAEVERRRQIRTTPLPGSSSACCWPVPAAKPRPNTVTGTPSSSTPRMP